MHLRTRDLLKFWEISASMSETVQDWQQKASRKSYVSYQMAPISMTLSDLECHCSRFYTFLTPIHQWIWHVLLKYLHCVPKKWAPKHFATATANLHRFKWNFTHTRRHLFLSSTSNFIRIPYSVYETFNSFKLLSQISVTDTTYFLLTSSVETHDL